MANHVALNTSQNVHQQDELQFTNAFFVQDDPAGLLFCCVKI